MWPPEKRSDPFFTMSSQKLSPLIYPKPHLIVISVILGLKLILKLTYLCYHSYPLHAVPEALSLFVYIRLGRHRMIFESRTVRNYAAAGPRLPDGKILFLLGLRQGGGRGGAIQGKEGIKFCSVA